MHCELGVIRDQTHGHTLGEYPFPCRVYIKTCYCTLFRFGDKPCTINIVLHKKTKKKGQHDCNKREKSLGSENAKLLELSTVMYTLNDSCSSVYLSKICSPSLIQPVKHIP